MTWCRGGLRRWGFSGKMRFGVGRRIFYRFAPLGFACHRIAEEEKESMEMVEVF